jgi:flagellar protein FlgJ
MGQISAAKNEQEYQLALQKYGLEMQKLAAGVDKTSLQGVWGTDAQGKNVYLQPTTSGKFVQAQAPEGVTLTPGIKTVDQATGTAIIDAKSGQGQGFIPKDIAGAESAKAVGKSQGEALSNLPTDIKNADETVSQIDQLLANPGLDAIVGTVDQYRPAWTLGTEGKDALARYNQLKGRAFLQAYGILRGGGQITEVEGAKAQDAMARMDRAQDESTFRTALEDFRDAVKTGVEKMRERAGQVTAPQGDVQGDQPKAAVRKTINGVTYEQDQNGDWYEAE